MKVGAGRSKKTKQLLQSATLVAVDTFLGVCRGYESWSQWGSVKEHDVGMDGITSSHSVCFAFLGEFLRCNTGVTPQVHRGSSLRSLQAGGMCRSFSDEWEWARLQAFLGQDGVSCLQGSTPTFEFVLLGTACPYSVIPGMLRKGACACWDPTQTELYLKTELPLLWSPALLGPPTLFLHGFNHVPSWTPVAMN